MGNFRKNFLTAALVLLLLGSVSLYVYLDQQRTGKLETSTTDDGVPLPVLIETENQEGDYSIRVLDTGNASSDETKKFPKMPDLSLPVVNYSHIDKAAFDIASQSIATLALELKKDPNDELKWLNLGIFRKMLGDYQTSAEILNYVAALWPKDYVPFNNLADLYQYYLKNYPQAEQNWLKVIELRPDYRDAYINLYNLYTNTDTGGNVQALNILLKGLASNPKSLDLMLYIARHYRSVGDYNNARIYYGGAVDQAQAENNESVRQALISEAAEMKN